MLILLSLGVKFQKIIGSVKNLHIEWRHARQTDVTAKNFLGENCRRNNSSNAIIVLAVRTLCLAGLKKEGRNVYSITF